MIRAVIFDLFGTLIANYGREDYLEVIEDMGRAVGAPPDEFRALWRRHYVDRLTGVHKTESDNIRWVCDQLGISPTDTQVEEANFVYIKFALPFLMRSRESAIPVLGHLRTRGINTGLISDCGPWVPDNWYRSPFTYSIDFPIYSCRAGAKKPTASLFSDAASGLEIDPSECIYVADGNGEELPAAEATGMRSIKITPWNVPDTTPDANFTEWDGQIIDHLTELLKIVPPI